MKDYKKIYFRMKKMLKKKLENYRRYQKDYNPAEADEVMEYYNYKVSIDDLECLLETLDEIECIKYSNILVNSHEFEDWKKEITL